MNQIAKQSVTMGMIALEVALLVAALAALETMSSPPQAAAVGSMAGNAGIGFAPEDLKASTTLTPCAYLPFISTPISGTPKDVRVYPVAIDKYGPQVAHHGDLAYAAWYGPPDYGLGNSTVSIASSTNGGWTWGQPVTATGASPAIAADVRGDLHIAYLEHTSTVDSVIYYSRSTDGGRTLAPPLAQACNSSYCSQPDIALDANGNAYIVWREETNIILGRVIIQGGDSVSITKTIVGTTTVGYAEPPQVAVSPSGQNVYVIWRCPPDYGSYVRTYFARSTDGGDTFGPRFNPTGFTRHGEYSPDVAAFGEDTVYITWVLDVYSDRRINFARSETSGESFSPRIEMGQSGSDYDSTIAEDDWGQVCVAWRQGATEEAGDVYFRCSLDRGQNFLPARMLTLGPPGTGQYSPALALWRSADATYVDAVWQDERDGYVGILFSSAPVTP